MMLFDNVRIIKKANKKEDRFIFLMDKVRANKRDTLGQRHDLLSFTYT